MVGHGGSSAGSYLADPTSPIPSHCTSIVATSTLRVKPLLSNLLLKNNAVLLNLSTTYCVVIQHELHSLQLHQFTDRAVANSEVTQQL